MDQYKDFPLKHDTKNMFQNNTANIQVARNGLSKQSDIWGSVNEYGGKEKTNNNIYNSQKLDMKARKQVQN